MLKTISILITLFIFFTTPAFPEVPDLERAEDYDAKIPVRVIKKFPLPKGYHEGLFFDGKHVWVNNGKNGKTWLIDPSTGFVVSEIEPVAGFTEGITEAGDGTFWLTDWKEKKLYRVSIEGDRMTVKYDISLDPAHPAGLVWTGDRLYVITWTRGMGTRYHLMQLDEQEHMFRKLRIKRIHEPAHLAWDGTHLWVTSWYNQLVYKIDVETFKVLGSFRSPAPDTTGITWDGTHFWITGTNAGLYRVEVE